MRLADSFKILYQQVIGHILGMYEFKVKIIAIKVKEPLRINIPDLNRVKYFMYLNLERI